MPLHVLIESECRWQAGRQPVRTMCFPNCTGVRFSLLGIQSAPSTTKGAMPSKVQWQCPSRKTEMKTNLACLSLSFWSDGPFTLSPCQSAFASPPSSIYPANSFLLRAASGLSPPSLERGGSGGRLISSSALSNFRSLRRLCL